MYEFQRYHLSKLGINRNDLLYTLLSAHEQNRIRTNKKGQLFRSISTSLNKTNNYIDLKTAISRAGNNKNIHGHIHEAMYKRTYNTSIINIIRGRKAHYSKSPTACRDDLLIKVGNKVVERCQLKDTVIGIDKTIKQIKNRYYRFAKVIGTKETAELGNKKLDKRGLNPSIHSSNISSIETKGLAYLKNGKLNFGYAKLLTRKAFVFSFAFDAATQGYKDYKHLKNKDIKLNQYMIRLSQSGILGGLKGSTSASSAYLATASTITLFGLLPATLIGISASFVVNSYLDEVLEHCNPDFIISKKFRFIEKHKAYSLIENQYVKALKVKYKITDTL